jgi:O-antigen/teichoic acid export membrane protein
MPILARVLGPEGLGAMSLALLMTPWLIAISSLAMEPTTTKLVSEFNAQNKSISPIIRGAYLIGLLSSSLATLIYFLLSDFIAWHIFKDPSLGFYIKIASPLIFITVLYTTSLGIFRGLKRFRLYAIFGGLNQLLIVIIGVILVLFLRFGVKGAIIALIIPPMILVIYSLYSLRHHITNTEGGEKELIIKFGFWLMIVFVVGSIFPTLDRLFLGCYEPTEVVGFYVPALTLVTAVALFTSAIRQSMFPYITESYAKKDLASTRRYLEGTIKYSLIVLGFFLILGMALGKEVIILLFTSTYLPSVPIFRVLLFVPFFSTAHILLHTFLVAIGEIKKLLIPTAAALVVSSISYALLVPFLHGVGAASALVIGYFALSIGYWLLARRSIDFSIKTAVKLMLLISTLLISIYTLSNVFLMPALMTNIMIALVFLAFYVVLLFALGTFDEEEIDYIKEKVKKIMGRG